ncbi:MAG: ChaB family protein [Micropruina sp.]|nr:MAG: ChaB family protein [Micropruina sp.]
MPKTNRDGSAKQSELPSTLRRSSAKAQKTYAHTYDAAMEQYHDEERAQRTAFASLKHTHEKVGDHWKEKDEYGPSDDRAEVGGLNDQPTAGGVDANATKAHLMELARRLEVKGRSRMTKAELVEALQRGNARASRQALENE